MRNNYNFRDIFDASRFAEDHRAANITAVSHASQFATQMHFINYTFIASTYNNLLENDNAHVRKE